MWRWSSAAVRNGFGWSNRVFSVCQCKSCLFLKLPDIGGNLESEGFLCSSLVAQQSQLFDLRCDTFGPD